MITITIARKPFVESTTSSVVSNYTGALNIDACRIDASNSSDSREQTGGRWPSNVLLLGPEIAASLDAQSGIRKSGHGSVKRSSASIKDGNRGSAYGAENRPEGTPMISYGDQGGASRFYKIVEP